MKLEGRRFALSNLWNSTPFLIKTLSVGFMKYVMCNNKMIMRVGL